MFYEFPTGLSEYEEEGTISLMDFGSISNIENLWVGLA